MKCDELKEVMNVMQVSGERKPCRYYKKTEVDAAIAELKQKLEDVQASMYADNVDLGMENRRMKRALWLLKARYFWILMVYASDLSKVANPSIIHKSNFLTNPTPRCMEEYQNEAGLYDNARIKCLKKAEEFK